ncbi:MAG: hypothetical protein IKM72_16735, partial [Oscillospiraceae bacterium]|nr:hypothetical protein [Oscillospiraceae bacterium]
MHIMILLRSSKIRYFSELRFTAIDKYKSGCYNIKQRCATAFHIVVANEKSGGAYGEQNSGRYRKAFGMCYA